MGPRGPIPTSDPKFQVCALNSFGENKRLVTRVRNISFVRLRKEISTK